MIAKKLSHLPRALQSPLVVWKEQRRLMAVWLGGLLQRDAVADRGDNILEGRVILGRIVHVVRGDAAQPECSCRPPKRLVPRPLTSDEVPLRLDEEAGCAEEIAVGGESADDVSPWPNKRDQAVRVTVEIVERDLGLVALGRAGPHP